MQLVPGKFDRDRGQVPMEHEQVAALLHEHRADMLAVAVGMLGWCPEAEDAVQDASLTAVAKIGQLREPDLAGAWLCSITRNVVRTHWRRPRREVLADMHQELPSDRVSTAPTPEQVLEQHEHRDWVWAGIDQLTPALQLPLMLRYFSSVTSYQEIANACELPIGTVRSRLSEARSRLALKLSEGGGQSNPDHPSAWTQRAAGEARDLFRAAETGTVRSALTELMHHHVVVTGPQGQSGEGRALLASIMDGDQEAGVRMRLTNAASSRTVTVLECQLASPPWDPYHCPPGVLWTLRRQGGKVDRIRLFHPS